MHKSRWLIPKQIALYISIFLLLASTAYAAAKLLGNDAPDFTLRGHQEENIKLSEYYGKVVMLNFWATWCGPCRQEIPKLTEIKNLHNEYDFELLGINIDEDQDKARQLAKKLNVNYPILFDEEKGVAKSYQVDAMPMTVLIGRDGKVRYIHRGYKEEYLAQYQQQIQKLKAE